MVNELSKSGDLTPLVSVIVITYNSSQTVLETLDSIKDQSYQNIELIVSDDCSPDDTVSVVENWIRENRGRFVSVEVVKAAQNTGIAPNCNRGVSKAKGDWVKLIAGDDLLCFDAISKFVEFTQLNPECVIVFGRAYFLRNGTLSPDAIPNIFSQQQSQQKITILKGSGVASVGAFVARKTLVDAGGFDDRYPMIEDAPLWVKLAYSGIKFYFLDWYVAKYRIHEGNTSRSSKNQPFIKVRFFSEQEKIIREILIPKLQAEGELLAVLNLVNYLLVMRLIILLGNRNNYFSRLLTLLVIVNSIKLYKRVVARVYTFLDKK